MDYLSDFSILCNCEPGENNSLSAKAIQCLDTKQENYWRIDVCWNVGGKNVFQTAKKRANGPKCPVTGKRIPGVSSRWPTSECRFLLTLLQSYTEFLRQSKNMCYTRNASYSNCKHSTISSLVDQAVTLGLLNLNCAQLNNSSTCHNPSSDQVECLRRLFLRDETREIIRRKYCVGAYMSPSFAEGKVRSGWSILYFDCVKRGLSRSQQCHTYFLLEGLLQVPHLRPTEYKTSRLHRHRKTVNRAYGGNLAGSAVRERYVISLSSTLIAFSQVWKSLVLLWWKLGHCMRSEIGSIIAALSGLSWLRSRRLWRRFWRSRSRRRNWPLRLRLKWSDY